MNLCDSAEEDGDNAGESEDLREQEGGVGHQHEERGLQQRVLSASTKQTVRTTQSNQLYLQRKTG